MPPKDSGFRNAKLYFKIGPGHYRPIPRGIRLMMENSRYGLSSTTVTYADDIALLSKEDEDLEFTFYV